MGLTAEQPQIFDRGARIPALPILPNVGFRGRHWSLERRYRREWHSFVAMAWNGKRPSVPLERAEVTLIRHSKREPDCDNLAASWKPVLDGLVLAGVIVDDSAAHIELRSQWQKTDGIGWVEMIVREVA